MRNHFLSAIFLTIILFSFQDSLAQNKKFDAGIFFNINANTVSRKDNNSVRAPAGSGFAGGMSLGISAKRMLSTHLHGTLELRYIGKGSMYNLAQGRGLLKLNYIEIPVLIGYSFLPDNANIILESGFAIAKLVLSEASVNSLVGSVGEENISRDFNDTDISWVAIVKRSIVSKNPNKAFIGFRFEHSIIKIHENMNLYNVNWGVQLEYVF